MASKTVVMAFGRFSPPTNGHELLIQAVVDAARKNSADHIIFASRTQDPKKNPLSVTQKVAYLKHSFKGVNVIGASAQVRTFIEAAKSLSGKYDNLIMIAGSDRVPEYETLLNKYNGKDFSFKTVKVVSAGERDPDSDTASGMSATKMRQAAAENNFSKFRQGTPSGMSLAMARRMFDDVRAGMNINEGESIRNYFLQAELFNVGDVVVYEEAEHVVKVKGTNYVILENGTRAWLHDLAPTNKINEAMKTAQQDKIKAAKIIAMSLGVDDTDGVKDPTRLVNLAIKKAKSKPMTPEARMIVGRMLELATSMDIAYDHTLASSIVREDVAASDYSLDKDGRKHHKVIHVKGSKRKDTNDYREGEGKYTNESVDDPTTNPHETGKLTATHGIHTSEYARVRKIQLKMHESEDEVDVDEIINNLTHDDILDHAYDPTEWHEVNLDESEQVNEVLSRVERLKAKARMRRTEAKRERKRDIAIHKKSTSAVITKRARRLAVKMLEKRIAKKPLSDLSVSEKERVERRIAAMSGAIKRLAVKLAPQVRKFENERLAK